MKCRTFAAHLALAFCLLLVGIPAFGDYLVRDGNGNLATIKSATTTGGAVLPQSVPSDVNGTPLFSQSNPGVVAPSATASGDALPLTNVPIAVPGLYNGSTLDRARSASGDGLASTGVAAKGGMLWNGTTFDRQRAAPGTTGIPSVDTESSKATCFAAFAFAPAGSPTDIVVLQGSGTKTLRLRRLVFGGYGTAGVAELSLIRRSTADTGGTSATPTIAKADTNDGACTGVVSTYTANPTTGTAVATLYNAIYGINAVGSGAQDRMTVTFGDHGGKALVLRGTTDFIALNLNGAGAFTNAYGTLAWTEE